MKLAVHFSAVLILLAAAEPSFATCGDQPGDAQAVANTRAQIASQCSCTGARNHGTYLPRSHRGERR